MWSSSRKLLCFALLVCAAAIVLSACGSSSGSSSSSSGSTSSGEGSGSEGESTTASTGGESGANSAKYTALLKEATEVTPSKYEGPTEPAPAKPGTKIAAISCAQTLQGCKEIAEGIEEAGSAAGVQVKVFDGQGETTTQNKQILAAISWGAEAIILEAIDPTTVQTGLAAAQKAGIVVGGAVNGTNSPNATRKPPAGDVWTSFDVGVNYKLAGEYEASWIIGDSEGKANTVVYGTKEFPALPPQTEGVMETLEACEGCTTDGPIYFLSSSLATNFGEEVVGYLRTHPEVEYIFCPYDPAAPAMVTAIETAGLSEQVKLVSILGNEQNLEFIRNEEVQAADGSYDELYVGWAVVDQALRVLDGQKPFEPQGENIPFQLVDKTNLPPEGQAYKAPFEFRPEFEKLWTNG
jgi:ribose transport system substrate-binding protein